MPELIRSVPATNSSEQVRVAIAQLNSELGDVAGNWARAELAISEASENGAQLILFPECFLQGYCADELFAETAVELQSAVIKQMEDAARNAGIWIVMGFARADASFPHLVYNSAVVVGPGGVHGWYDKTHLGTYLDYREGVYFSPGNEITVFDLPFARVGVQICYDISFPEVSRVLALDGAEINLVLSAGPDEFRESWGPLLRVRSSENLFWSVYANTVGDQKSTHFFGGSRIVAPNGETRTQGPFDTEACVIGDIDLAELRLLRRKTLRFRDRVPQLYRPITTGGQS